MTKPIIKREGFWADGINGLLLRDPYRAYTKSTPKEDDSETRYYGGDGTWHGTDLLNVEVDEDGTVVAVWFRCTALPFDVSTANSERADMMNKMYKEHPPLEGIDAIVLRKRKK